jgi:peptide-methionine (S)-S-oxide reductase
MDSEIEGEVVTLGGGCFWCTEAVFNSIEGVLKVISGYSGGKPEDATYGRVSSGRTGHAEVVQVTFDPDVITFRELLEVFFATHDPTSLNRQGWENPIVTQVEPYEAFHRAEEGHMDYYERNRGQPYCRLVIDPKILKLRERFRDRLKAVS